MNFCERIKELRKEKNATQQDVAKGCGLTPTCICQLETGARNPTGSTVAVLAQYFDVSADYLLGLEDDFGVKVKETEKSLRAYDQHEITDKQTVDLIKLYKALSDYNKAVVFGYVVRLIEESGLNVKSVLRN